MIDVEFERLRNDYLHAEDTQHKVNSCLNLCVYLSGKLQYEEVIHYGSEISEILKDTKNDDILCKIYSLMANSYSTQGDLSMATEYLQRALLIAEEMQNGYYLAHIYYNFSLLEDEKYNLKQALDYLFKSVHLCELNGFTDILIENFIRIGNTYLYFENYSLALEYLRKALKQTKNETQKASIYYCIGKIHYDLNDLSEAHECFKRAFKMFKKNNNKYQQIPLYIHYGYISLRKGNFDLAMENAETALALAKEHGSQIPYFESLLLFAVIYTDKNDFINAKHYYNILKEIESTIHNIHILKNFYQTYLGFNKMIENDIECEIYENKLQGILSIIEEKKGVE